MYAEQMTKNQVLYEGFKILQQIDDATINN